MGEEIVSAVIIVLGPVALSWLAKHLRESADAAKAAALSAKEAAEAAKEAVLALKAKGQQ
jgi:hypothetical protein